jgi:hypothetical protein
VIGAVCEDWNALERISSYFDLQAGQTRRLRTACI